MRYLLILAFSIAISALSACGQKGDLYLPKEPAAQTSTKQEQDVNQ